MINNFNIGDIIIFCNEEFVVIKNYGNFGTVKENCENGELIHKFYWEYQGEHCKLKS